MLAIGVRLIWLVISSVALSFGSYIVVTDYVLEKESGTTQPVELIDHLRPGVHYISGMVTVPSACDELTVRVVKIDEFNYDLRFQTWEEPAVRCAHDPVPRYFTTVAFAPAAGVHFTAQMDGTPFPIRMKQRVIAEDSIIELNRMQMGQ
jgi:hypothetical protein